MKDEDILIDLFEAGEAFVGGDESGLRRLLPYMINKEVYGGSPVVFYVADDVGVLDFLCGEGVDFYQKTKLGGSSLLHQVSLRGTDEVFEWMLAWYKDNDLVDASDDAGVTSLSSLIKFGNVSRATRLIESGADLKSVAENGLTPALQSVLCLDGEKEGIECLSMLFSKGLALNVDELTLLGQAARSLNRLSIAKYIDEKLA
jgi:hypothetical protein